MSNIYKNAPQDFELKYKASTYEFIEKILNQDSKDIPLLLFMLALLGLSEDKRVPMDSETTNDSTHTFSMRTMYTRYESDFDAYIGLVSILSNTKLPPEDVINTIAFERTGFKNKPFLKMSNVKSFFEYVLGGIDVFSSKFFIYEKNEVGIVDAIHDFLSSDVSKVEDLMRDMLLEEIKDNE